MNTTHAAWPNSIAVSMTALALWLLLAGCAESSHQLQSEDWRPPLPPELEQQLNPSVEFPTVQANPSPYRGKTVMFGGIVLSAKRTADQTEIEVLELPLRDRVPQTSDRMRSRGRFLAVQETFLDPAVVPAGTPLTVIGEVTGSTTRPLDQSRYTFPVLAIKHLIDWNTVAAEQGNTVSGYPAPYYYSPGFWWGPYGGYPYWGYPYWGYPPIIIRQPVPPPPPPPSSVPPQFQKGN